MIKATSFAVLIGAALLVDNADAMTNGFYVQGQAGYSHAHYKDQDAKAGLALVQAEYQTETETLYSLSGTNQLN